MPVHLEADWGRSRRHDPEEEKKATEIILGAKTVADDAIFAKKLHMNPYSVRNIRLGLRWKKLRQELEKHKEQTI